MGSANRVPVGDVLPDIVGGLTNSFSYKNWDLSLALTFQLGGDIYDSSSKRQLGVVTDWNFTDHIIDRWQEPGDGNLSRFDNEPRNIWCLNAMDKYRYVVTRWFIHSL